MDTLLTEPSLAQLLSTVEGCCSDDETDDEAPPPADARQKCCVVLNVPWRHPRVTRLMMELDRIRENREEYNGQAPPKRLRRRSAHATASTIPARSELPIGAYNANWLSTLSGHEAADLKPASTPAIGHLIEVLKSL
jgi:hypothetical protein